MNIIKKIPLPIAGLMLALASLGNMLSGFGQIIRYTFGTLSFIIFALLVVKFFTSFNTVKNKIGHPVVASVLPTFTMGMMVLATYIIEFSKPTALIFWYISILLHLGFEIWFTKEYIMDFDIKRIFPSYFIVYAGVVVASVTAPSFNHILTGKVIFWIGLITYLAILPVVIYRTYKYSKMPDSAIPTIAIFTAPSNLCLAGYLTVFKTKDQFLLYFLLILSISTFAYVIYHLPRLLKVEFYPSYSAFTFPFVISTMAMKKSYMYFKDTTAISTILKHIYVFQTVLSIVLVLYVLYKYIEFILKSDHSPC